MFYYFFLVMHSYQWMILAKSINQIQGLYVLFSQRSMI